MIELLIEKEIDKFCILDENFNLTDVTDILKKEVKLHKILREHCKEDFVINDEYTEGTCPEIYDLLIEKAYSQFDIEGAAYFIADFHNIVEYNLLNAFNKKFKSWCETSLNQSIDKISYA